MDFSTVGSCFVCWLRDAAVFREVVMVRAGVLTLLMRLTLYRPVESAQCELFKEIGLWRSVITVAIVVLFVFATSNRRPRTEGMLRLP